MRTGVLAWLWRRAMLACVVPGCEFSVYRTLQLAAQRVAGQRWRACVAARV